MSKSFLDKVSGMAKYRKFRRNPQKKIINFDRKFLKFLIARVQFHLRTYPRDQKLKRFNTASNIQYRLKGRICIDALLINTL